MPLLQIAAAAAATAADVVVVVVVAAAAAAAKLLLLLLLFLLLLLVRLQSLCRILRSIRPRKIWCKNNPPLGSFRLRFLAF